MLSYETQLDLERNIIVKAYQNYSGSLSFRFLLASLLTGMLRAL